MPQARDGRADVVISYSHADEPLLRRLQIFLTPFERGGVFDYWDDKRIEPGKKWRNEIRRALMNAKVAILLVSDDFLASEFIRENELPPLLHAAKIGGTVILPVIVGPSAFSQIKGVSELQAVNDPKKPLKKLSGVQRDDVFNDLANRVVRALGATGVAPSRRGTTAKPGKISAGVANAHP